MDMKDADLINEGFSEKSVNTLLVSQFTSV